MRGWWGIVILAACFAPNPPAGRPCGAFEVCPAPLVCRSSTLTCESANGPDAPSDLDGPTDASIDAPILIDGCTPAAEICGDGLDQSCDGIDPACSANDGPGGAVDVTAGGTFPGNAVLARDDVAPNGCGSVGGKDLFYKVVLSAPEVFYFDTFNSSFDTVLRVYAKPCANVGTGGGATACIDDACSGDQSQLAIALPTGESCIVIDQASSSETTGTVSLNVIRGGRDGRLLPSGTTTLTGDTCARTNSEEPLDQDCDGPGSGGKDQAFFFTTCPGQTLRLDATTCNPATMSWDPVLYASA